MAHVVRDCLEDIYRRKGRLVPIEIEEEARAEDHPLHKFLTWDDELAASLRRQDEIRGLIRSVKIRYAVEDEVRQVRQWHAAWQAAPHRTGFVPDEEIRDDPGARRLLLGSMEREWRSLRLRYGHLQEFWEVVAAADPEAKTA